MTGYKTLIVAAAVAVVGALQGLDIAALIPNDPQTAGWIVTGLGVVMGILRFMTSTPVGGASPK